MPNTREVFTVTAPSVPLEITLTGEGAVAYTAANGTTAHTFPVVVDAGESTGFHLPMSAKGDLLLTALHNGSVVAFGERFHVGDGVSQTFAPSDSQVAAAIDAKAVVLATDATTTSQTPAEVSALSFPVTAGVVYEVRGLLVYEAEAADDFEISWTNPGTPTGYVLVHGLGTSTASQSGGVQNLGWAWTATVGLGAIGTVDANDILAVPILGSYESDTAGDVVLNIALSGGTAGTGTLYAGSFLRFDRIAS